MTDIPLQAHVIATFQEFEFLLALLGKIKAGTQLDTSILKCSNVQDMRNVLSTAILDQAFAKEDTADKGIDTDIALQYLFGRIRKLHEEAAQRGSIQTNIMTNPDNQRVIAFYTRTVLRVVLLVMHLKELHAILPDTWAINPNYKKHAEVVSTLTNAFQCLTEQASATSTMLSMITPKTGAATATSKVRCAAPINDPLHHKRQRLMQDEDQNDHDVPV